MVGAAAPSLVERGGSVSIGVEGISLVRLGAEGLAVVGGGPRKGRKLPSFLEGFPFFWPRPMLERRVLPGMLSVWWESQEIDLRRNAL